MAIKLENRAQKVGWKTTEREELCCIGESVAINPFLVCENRLVTVVKRRRVNLKMSKTIAVSDTLVDVYKTSITLNESKHVWPRPREVCSMQIHI